jgi:L-aspartate oxidase
VSRSDSTDLDLLVLGSGVAGLSAAVRAATEHGFRTGVVTKDGLEQATTRWAQGGVAAALSADPEDVDLHFADTLAAGAGLCDLEAVRVLVDEGPRRVEELIALGARFDRDAQGNLELAREGGHSVPRIVHAGGAATGEEIERALVDAVRRTAVVIHEETFVVDLLLAEGRCVGVSCLTRDGAPHEVRARHVLLAAGGAGQVYSVTTNPPAATGDGVAMALRAGAAVGDVEFFQFHPTALHHPSTPRPLLTEALRGHGAKLRDSSGERFVDELLPRDVVSRAILSTMLAEGSDHVWLDCRELPHFEARFPTIAASLAAAGLDASVDLLPVSPAAHHLCGGVLTDLDGATSIPGLWAAGEVACTGVHGANRLASNSLLEGMVFAPRAVEAIVAAKDGPSATGVMKALLEPDGQADDPFAIGVDRIAVEAPTGHSRGDASAAASSGTDELRARLQSTMMADAGVMRSEESLQAATDALTGLAEAASGRSSGSLAAAELENLLLMARTMVASALARQESRGTHQRIDFPEPREAQRRRLVHWSGAP